MAVAGPLPSNLSHRFAQVSLTLQGPTGAPLADQAVTLGQVRHKFLVGCNAFRLGSGATVQLEQDYRDRFAQLCNYATLPFYWGAYEAHVDEPHAVPLRCMAHWCCEHGIAVKGHPLCWHEVVPKWLSGKSPQEVAARQMERIGRDVAAFAGWVDTWDVINESVAMPEYQRDTNPIAALCHRLGRHELITQVFARARQANPKARLLINDYDLLEEYERIIEECLGSGVSIDAIGLQAHMHRGYMGAERIGRVCDRFARLGKPLHFTELTLLSGALKTDEDWHKVRTDWPSTAEGEARQAQQAEDIYRTLFGHKAVEAVTWWDLSDAGAWQGAPAGLIRADMTPKPAYEALLRLFKQEWWTGPLELRTDQTGTVRFEGFLGDYTAQAAGGQAKFTLDKPGLVQAKATLSS